MATVPLMLMATAMIGCGVSLALTPPIRRVARAWRLVDRPDSHRKLQEGPIPLGGGIALLLGTSAAVLAALLLPHPWRSLLGAGGRHLLGLLAAAMVVMSLGLADDLFRLRCRYKILGQVAAALLVVASGLQIRGLQFLGGQLELGLLAIPFTLFWIVGAINALNLLDGSDGVAATVGVVLSLALAAMAWMQPQHQIDAVVALALAGTLLGFLVYNLPPASVYLGDAGSMLIGLVIGVLALRCSLTNSDTVVLALPTALLAIPILDTAMAILRRTLTGHSIYLADRGHLHHCLLRRGFSRRRTVACIGGLCVCTAVSTLVGFYHQSELVAAAGALAVVSFLITARYFGHAEWRRLTRRVAQSVRSLLSISVCDARQICEERVYAVSSTDHITTPTLPVCPGGAPIRQPPCRPPRGTRTALESSSSTAAIGPTRRRPGNC